MKLITDDVLDRDRDKMIAHPFYRLAEFPIAPPVVIEVLDIAEFERRRGAVKP